MVQESKWCAVGDIVSGVVGTEFDAETLTSEQQSEAQPFERWRQAWRERERFPVIPHAAEPRDSDEPCAGE